MLKHSLPPSLTPFALLSFDVYGTLIDWETGLYAAAAPLLSQSSPTTSPLSRAEFLTLYNTLEHAQQAATPHLKYSALLSLVYTQIASALSLPTPSREEADAFGASVGDWPPFADSADALRRLKRYYRLVVLSNVDEASFAASLPGLGGQGVFDAVLTAEAVGCYKPDLRNFEYLLREVRERFGVERGAVLHTAQSLVHDHVPAGKMGIRSVWISRRGAAIGGGDIKTGEGEGEGGDIRTMEGEGKIGAWEWRFDTLGEMADAVEREFSRVG